MLPVTEGVFAPKPARSVVYKDAYLEAVFRGQEFLVFDGGMGSMIQASGTPMPESPELLNVTHPEVITAIHRAYVEAGSQVISTNTFGASPCKLRGLTVEEAFTAAVACARAAGAPYVAADLGPTGALLEPMGTMPFDECYEQFACQVKAAVAAGADLIIIETMGDLLEAKAAVLAAKEHSDLPIIASMTYGADGRTFLGTPPDAATITLCALGVDAVGVNCSLGPDALAPIVARILENATVPVIVQANAGLPRIEDGRTVYTVTPAEYVTALRPLVEAGVTLVGGCCGTNPDFIRAEVAMLSDLRPAFRAAPRTCSLTSSQRAFVLEGRQVGVIGERLNPTGKKKMKEALRAANWDYLLSEAIGQTEAGADVLDLNVGLPEIDEVATLRTLVGQIQAVSPLPLQIDSSDPAAVEAAVRVYSGKPIINSVNGKVANMAAVLPIVKHYGCAVVGLCLDEDGIPATAAGRFAVAQRIVEACDAWGIPRTDVYIDCLVMAASTNQPEVPELLEALRLCKERLGVRTVLGVSNISFGLPQREVVNAAFLAAAFNAGLDLPILNPNSAMFRQTVDAWRVLCGQDADALRYAEVYANLPAVTAAATAAPAATASQGAQSPSEAPTTPEGQLTHCVLSGRRSEAAAAVQALLDAGTDPMAVISDVLIPALDEVGVRFEQNRIFLPQLMAAAEAAKAGFDVVKAAAPTGGVADKGALALATVKGDIHDIGKNIVKMLLENYGFKVYDLGRDVEPQAVVDCVRQHDLTLVGLSALMTTTVKGMEETIALLHRETPHVKVFVGGAVITEEVARMVGADYYTKDAAESAKVVSAIFAG